MRIVVKNIQDLQEQQVQKILREWIPITTDPACYYTVKDNLGQYYANAPNHTLKAFAVDFNTKIKSQLGPNSCIEVCAVQELPRPPKAKKLLGGIKNDEMFKEYLKSPQTWRLESAPKKRNKKTKKLNPKEMNIAKRDHPPATGTSEETPGDKDKKEPKETKKKKPKKPKNKKPKGDATSEGGDAKTDADKPKKKRPQKKKDPKPKGDKQAKEKVEKPAKPVKPEKPAQTDP